MTAYKIMNILVTAGPTREPIDPVRFISNYSTGLLGWEIAREAKRRGHRVILIRGPMILAKLAGVPSIDVQTTRQMKKEIERRFNWCDCLLMTAAVCDFRPKIVAKRKLKRAQAKAIALTLKQNPDILAGLGRRKGKRALIGFALETEDLKKNARDKLRAKNLDLLVATLMNTSTYPFGPAKISALIMHRNGHSQRLARTTKARLARILLDSIEKIMLS